MGTRRRYLFVLLFVLGLVDRLGAGHRQQGDEARPRPAGRARARLPGPADRHRDRSQRRRHRRLDLDHRTADQQARRLRARSRAPGHRQDHRQPARHHRRQPRRRTGRHHRPALLLRLGAEPDRPGAGDRRPPRPANRRRRPLKASEKRWKEAGRNAKSTENQQLIFAGAYPTAYEAAQLASEQEPDDELRELLGRQAALLPLRQGRAARPDRRPRADEEGPLRQPDREETAEGRDRRRSPGRARSSSPNTRPTKTGKIDETAKPGWYALQGRPGALAAPTSPTRSRNTARTTNRSSPSTSPTRAAKPSRKSPARSPSAARRRRSARSAPKKRQRSPGHFAVVLDNEVKTRPIINFAENPDGIDGRTGAQISGGFNRHRRGPGTGDDAADRRPADQPQTDQRDPGLGDPRHAGARTTGIKAGIIGLALVVIFLLLYYRFLGLIASIALGAYGVIFFALINLIPITLTLPGIAGPGADDRRRRRLQHRHLRANKGGGAGGALDVERDQRRLQTRDQHDHRRQRRHPADRLHPLRAGDRRASRASPSPSASARSSRC